MELTPFSLVSAEAEAEEEAREKGERKQVNGHKASHFVYSLVQSWYFRNKQMDGVR